MTRIGVVCFPGETQPLLLHFTLDLVSLPVHREHPCILRFPSFPAATPDCCAILTRLCRRSNTRSSPPSTRRCRSTRTSWLACAPWGR